MPESAQPRRRLAPEQKCNLGNCPWIDVEGDDALVNGYTETGAELVVRLPLALLREAVAADA